ncbi:hypothetical protein M0804_002510 [Polistes exclamans]|nr:hypothetical protein M0804_002510 [Polistes exclamans]
MASAIRLFFRLGSKVLSYLFTIYQMFNTS